MSTPQQQQPKLNRGIVKQVLSGDSLIIRGQPKGGPPPEKQINLSFITAPKLARRPGVGGAEGSKDEPYAWEAREFLRKKLVGEEVLFTLENSPNTTREYGSVYLGKDTTSGENITESLLAEGLATVRDSVRQTPDGKRLAEIEEAAKTAGKGKWSQSDLNEHIRDIKWNIENLRVFVDKCAGKPQRAIIEHVRDGSTVRAFLLPEFYHITLMISGIRCPGFKLDADGKPDLKTKVPFAEEAKFFVERALLQRDVEIVLESVNNNNFVGTILHPKGNIAEELLKQGFARCVDWSIAFMKSGADKLRAAEREAKEKKLRLWKEYQPSGPQISGKEKEFTATVVEIINGDALTVKLADGSQKKIFLASIRPPREQSKPTDEKSGEPAAPAPRPKGFRPLYDIPWMFEAREFLRKKLIGKKVHVVVDYIQPARDNFPEKTCCTVTLSNQNIAEALVSKGLATVVRYRQDDDQRSSHYDELLAAEVKAAKASLGVHAKKNIPSHRVVDTSGDPPKAKQHFPSLQRAHRTEALVEFVTSGSRLRLYIPKDTCLVTFLLAGINCPRGSRPGPTGGQTEGEPFGEEALQFTRERCIQREVEISVETMDKAGNFIGWLWVDGHNLSVLLVEAGLASVHFSAERSEHYRALKNAQDQAKNKKLNMWKNYVEVEEEEEEEKKIEEDKNVERRIDYQKVYVIETTPELHFYAQMVDQGPKLDSLKSRLNQELCASPPVPGAYTPKKGDMCAAKFVDEQWYRAKVEKVTAKKVSVFYIDYGNREEVDSTRLASLPSAFAQEKPYAHQYGLACAKLPPKESEYHDEALQVFDEDVKNKCWLLNIEYKINGFPYASLTDAEKPEEDLTRRLIEEGFLLVDPRREKRLQKFVQEYQAAQEAAKKKHSNVWQYGDITEDDAKEFGLGR